MTKNLYFTNGTFGEQNLIQDLIDEQLKIYGIEVYYIPRKIYEDRAWHDIYYSEFKESYLIEMYLENFEGFGGGDLLSKFGMQVSDEITLTVSRRRWKDFVDVATNKIVDGRPNEGDLIFFPLNNSVFEIKFVENQSPFYQLNKLYIYTMTCEVFRYGDSIFDTGIKEIDKLEKDPGGYTILMSAGGTGSYKVGETITGVSSSKTAKVASWNPSTRELGVVYTNGNFAVGENIRGSETSATWQVSSYKTIDLLDAYADNLEIEQEADEIIDFSESNPFGTFGNNGGSF